MKAKSSPNDPATKADLKKLSSEVKNAEKLLRGEILRVEERVEKLEEGQMRMEVTLNKISIQLDGFVGRVDDLTNENEIGTEQISVLQAKVKDHDKRIVKLESRN